MPIFASNTQNACSSCGQTGYPLSVIEVDKPEDIVFPAKRGFYLIKSDNLDTDLPVTLNYAKGGETIIGDLYTIAMVKRNEF